MFAVGMGTVPLLQFCKDVRPGEPASAHLANGNSGHHVEHAQGQTKKQVIMSFLFARAIPALCMHLATTIQEADRTSGDDFHKAPTRQFCLRDCRVPRVCVTKIQCTNIYVHVCIIYYIHVPCTHAFLYVYACLPVYM